MSEVNEGAVLPLPIDPQIVSQQAQSTIKSIVDAVVELLTNCDDSYRRMELAGLEPDGDVSIHIIREKGGVCPLFEMGDHAEGMDWPALERAITFAASASGFFEGRTVRGLFGRGLKEAIIGLGKGQIRTVRDGVESISRSSRRTEHQSTALFGSPGQRTIRRERELRLTSSRLK